MNHSPAVASATPFSIAPSSARSESLIVCEVEAPLRCIFLAEVATIRHRRKRLGIFIEALNTSPDRMRAPCTANCCIDEGPCLRRSSLVRLYYFLQGNSKQFRRYRITFDFDRFKNNITISGFLAAAEAISLRP